MKPPDFSPATLEITKVNIYDVLNATNKNYSAVIFSNHWLSSYINFTSDFKKSYTATCESGNIYGQIEDEDDSSSKYRIEADLTFNECMEGGETISGKVHYVFSITDSHYTDLSEGNFSITDFGGVTTFTDHLFFNIEKSSSSEIQEYAQISIYSPLVNEGIVNYYTVEKYESDSSGTTGEDFVEGANGTSIKILYTDSGTKYYLNGELFSIN